MRSAAGFIVAGATWLVAPGAAHAQVGVGGGVDVIAGLEGGGSGYAAGVRRTRTTLRVGLDLWPEASPENVLSLGALVEIEPAASIGADLRYERHFGGFFLLHLGGTAVFAPEYLIGASAGIGFRIELSKQVDIHIGPTANVYFVGSDLPDDQPLLWQATLGLGLRVAF
jgi:hypothetical protein